MCIQVHDEICGVCDSQYREKALARKIHLMENAVVFPEFEGVVKFPVDGSAGLTWGEGKSDGAFGCTWCKGRGKVAGKKCPTCKGNGDFNVKRAGDIWVAEKVA
jgi:RecJ-like exonuclease